MFIYFTGFQFLCIISEPAVLIKAFFKETLFIELDFAWLLIIIK